LFGARSREAKRFNRTLAFPKAQQFWQQKAQRSFLLEQMWLTELKSPHLARLYLARRDCDEFEVSSSSINLITA
jgi:hypothetical protein